MWYLTTSAEGIFAKESVLSSSSFQRTGYNDSEIILRHGVIKLYINAGVIVYVKFSFS